MPTPEQADVAELMLRKAAADLGAARVLAASDDPDDGIVGFHAQQAVEKSLKAVLAVCGKEFPRSHDLGVLIDLANETTARPPEDLQHLEWLSPWAATMRYDESASTLDQAAALDTAERSVAWAKSVVLSFTGATPSEPDA